MHATKEVVKTLPRKFVRVRDRNQITLPNEIVAVSPIAKGDFLEVLLMEDGTIQLKPTRIITSLNSPEALRQSARAQQDIADGNYKTFRTADDLMDELIDQPRRTKVAAAGKL